MVFVEKVAIDYLISAPSCKHIYQCWNLSSRNAYMFWAVFFFLG